MIPRAKRARLISFRWPLRCAIALGMVAGALLAVTHSWTVTPHGRLDYRAALVSRILAWMPSRVGFDPAVAPNSPLLRALLRPAFEAPEAVERIDESLRTRDGADVSLWIYRPERGESPLPFYLNLHAGGWSSRRGYPDHGALADFATRANSIVVSVDYRLTPEFPYPVPLEDCEDALVWIAREGTRLGGDPTRIAVGGMSAGANLAAALAQRAKRLGGPEIRFQFLSMPITDLSGTRDWVSMEQADDRYALLPATLDRMIAEYVPDPRRRIESDASPLLIADLSGLPAALVVTARFDPLRDQGEAYAARLRAAGVSVELHRVEGAIHGFLGSPGRASEIQERAARAVRAALAR